MQTYLLLAVLAIHLLGAFGLEPTSDKKISQCLEDCLKPMVKMERTISYLFRNYEKLEVCDLLEKSARCSQKCSREDQQLHFQYSTFYRVHCVDMEELLEDHIECLKEASYKADIGHAQCADKKAESKTLSKEEQRKSVCKSVDCSTVCYFKEFVAKCADAKEALLQVNMRNADEMRRLIIPSAVEKMDIQCQRIHDADYMRKRMLGQL